MQNVHRIRTQKNQPNAVVRKPYILYKHPGPEVHDYKLIYNPKTLREVQERYKNWDIDTYLTPDADDFCQAFFKESGFDPENIRFTTPEERLQPLSDVYLRLRAAIRQRNTGELPPLTLLEPPSGTYDWQPSAIDRNEDLILETDLETDGAQLIT